MACPLVVSRKTRRPHYNCLAGDEKLMGELLLGQAALLSQLWQYVFDGHRNDSFISTFIASMHCVRT
jgi:hypothetical protein